MKHLFFTVAVIALCMTGCVGKGGERAGVRTFCNPVNLSYRFCLENPSRREAADPTVVPFKDRYYMFVSKSGGYFTSNDLIHWKLIAPQTALPLEHYAPTAWVMDGAVYFLAGGDRRIFKSADPESGIWETVQNSFKLAYSDPAVFLDDDGRLYYFAGCSHLYPTVAAEIDRATLNITGEAVKLIDSDAQKHGWEVMGDYNSDDSRRPTVEGSWVNKHGGKYYLQYSNPGTEYKSYNDGVYVSGSPLGPYVLAEHNPFASRPEGFVSSAGHGSTFQDRYGNYWHLGTATLSVRQIFERRLDMFPVFFDDDGEMYAHSGFGDYPMTVPDRKISSPDELFPGWMLLSYRKKTSASSTLKMDTLQAENMKDWFRKVDGFSAENAVDEEIRTWWSAETGNRGEWFAVDLDEICEVRALQINFADHDAVLLGDSVGRRAGFHFQYTVEESADGKNWKMLVDNSLNTSSDAAHEYIQLEKPVETRHLRITNIRVPSGKFSLYGFRVFGKSPKPAPREVINFTADRHSSDPRKASLKWDAVPGATGYNIRYGSREGKLYHNYMIYGANSLQINSLHAGKPYFFTIDAFNEGGITRGKTVLKLN